MKAITVSSPGGPENLILNEVPDPVPGPRELLVDLEAAGINYIDTYHRGGLYPMDFPITPGLEGAGVVLETGDGVEGFATGDRVAWTFTLGSYAQKQVIPADEAVAIPDTIATDLAAAVMLQGLTAHYLATATYPLTGEDRCLIHAGAGGVGLLLTQIAKIRGAEVFTTVGTDEKAESSREAGADHVIVYTSTDFRPAIESIAGERALDVVYDGVGAATFEEGLALLKPRGMMVSFGNASGPVPEISPLHLAQHGSLYLTRPTLINYIASRDELISRAADLFDWMETGLLGVRIGSEYPLADAADAHRALEGRHTTGKILLRP